MEPLANKICAEISTLDVGGILYLTFSLFISKTAQIKVENLAQTIFRYSPAGYHAPYSTMCV